MATPVELPKSGNTVEECVIGRWVKQAGDAVSPGDVIAEVETDKATFEITAPVGGTLLATFFPEGALVPVFTTVCVIGIAGEDVEPFRPGAAVSVPSPQSPVPTPVLSPRARRFAAERSFEPAGLIGSGPGGRVLEHDVRMAYEAARAATTATFSRPTATGDQIARQPPESPAMTGQYTLHASAD